MQISNNPNCNSTAFGARFRVKPEHIDHVMTAIDKRCDIIDLRRIYYALKSGEKGIGSDDVIFIEPVLQRGKKVISPDCGFMKTKINGSDYTNDVIPTMSFWSLPHYFEKIQRLSKEKFLDASTNFTNRADELLEQFDRTMDRLIVGKKGSTARGHRRDCLVDAIYYTLTKK